MNTLYLNISIIKLILKIIIFIKRRNICTLINQNRIFHIILFKDKGVF